MRTGARNSAEPVNDIAVKETIVTLRYPVLLMHGLGLSAFLFEDSGFEKLAERLRLDGIEANAARVPPYSSISERARAWQHHIQGQLAETGAERINLVAFSAGGLDARFGISRLWDPSRVAALVTISTPHRGSSLAEAFLKLDKLTGRLISRRMNALAKKHAPGETADAVSAFGELTRKEVVDNFNPATPDRPEVAYLSFSAAAGQGTRHAISLPLIVGNRILYAKEGPNDGFVSKGSAQWGEHVEEVGADHAQLFGIPFARKSFDMFAFYRKVCLLLHDRGF